MPSSGRNDPIKEVAVARRITKVKTATSVAMLCLFLGCCSAWRPDAEQSLTKGQESLKAGEYGKAREHFEAALKSKPDQEASEAGLLQVLRETGLYAEARRLGTEF